MSYPWSRNSAWLPSLRENLLDLLQENKGIYEKAALIGRLLNRGLSRETGKSLPLKALHRKRKTWRSWII